MAANVITARSSRKKERSYCTRNLARERTSEAPGAATKGEIPAVHIDRASFRRCFTAIGGGTGEGGREGGRAAYKLSGRFPKKRANFYVAVAIVDCHRRASTRLTVVLPGGMGGPRGGAFKSGRSE